MAPAAMQTPSKRKLLQLSIKRIAITAAGPWALARVLDLARPPDSIDTPVVVADAWWKRFKAYYNCDSASIRLRRT